MVFSIGNSLAELRRAKNMTQKELAEKLLESGVEGTSKAIHYWEKGASKPNVEQFLALCNIFNVDDIMWQFAGIHKGPYTGLNQAGRVKAREFIDLLFHIDMYRDEPAEDAHDSRLMKLYALPVSAGTGNFLDNGSYDMIDVPEYVPSSADFALCVSGNSMEPLFQDGQIIWIKEQQTLNHGEIGVFEYDSDAYCKKYILQSDTAILRSLNPDYKDIEVNEELGIRIIGKVVS